MIITSEWGYKALTIQGNAVSLAPVAQWIEYWPPKPRVAGSIPAGRAKTEGFLTCTVHKKVKNIIIWF